ncbi:hypothetical protein L2E82_31479 [Cichorium intybus]|uniref:Uncharacterized protein n=1 Tax=Cichorium intybus TaxID=13427 RepID=A0ACB9BEJ7_CICIN|nr:hypothetical protein L2E82_31479 [Cichorium intybus]
MSKNPLGNEREYQDICTYDLARPVDHCAEASVSRSTAASKSSSYEGTVAKSLVEDMASLRYRQVETSSIENKEKKKGDDLSGFLDAN